MKLTTEDRARLDAVLRRVEENVRLAAKEDAESEGRREANRPHERRHSHDVYYARPEGERRGGE